METLNKKMVNNHSSLKNHAELTQKRPEKVMQFGEGNFLRAFVDWMFDTMNQEGLFDGSVVVVQPIEQGLIDVLNQQDGLYTLYLRGLQNGQVVEEKSVNSVISRGINPYSDYTAYLECAKNPEMRFIISNTTEAGIAYNAADQLDDQPQISFPGKLTAFLYQRFKAFSGDPDKGLVMIPCELIDRNGDQLKKIVLRLAEEWQLGKAFIEWVEQHNYFLNTLVDRIVTGYPRDEIAKLTEELGYQDQLINTGEIFHLWVIEGDSRFSEELPFTKAGLNVVWTDDLKPYRDRKVRILNGAHTMTVLAAHLYGLKTVKECLEDDVICTYLKKGIFEEIIPTLDLPENELKDFAEAVLERFANPFIKHYLLSIALNSVSKFKTRVLPSILTYIERKQQLPQVLTFSLSALIAFYEGEEANDDAEIVAYFKEIWKSYDGSEASAIHIAETVLACEQYWGENLNQQEGFSKAVGQNIYRMKSEGIAQSLNTLLNQ